MLGIGKVWKSVTTGAGPAPLPSAPLSTIPRGLPKTRSPATEPEPLWDDGAQANDARAADRFVPLRNATILATASGRRCSARIINLSRTGVAVEADFREFGPEEVALVGTRPVVPGRPIKLGAVFQFKKPLDPKLCDPAIVL